MCVSLLVYVRIDFSLFERALCYVGYIALPGVFEFDVGKCIEKVLRRVLFSKGKHVVP